MQRKHVRAMREIHPSMNGCWNKIQFCFGGFLVTSMRQPWFSTFISFISFTRKYTIARTTLCYQSSRILGTKKKKHNNRSSSSSSNSSSPSELCPISPYFFFSSSNTLSKINRQQQKYKYWSVVESITRTTKNNNFQFAHSILCFSENSKSNIFSFSLMRIDKQIINVPKKLYTK